ncbi:MAG TPA: glycosyltransferase family 39 protein, partial [Solirubrobacteraceae bacterium]|nr:glycosyltransferase family 39 protein [Solirubrobacteraceae bacterium]
MNTVPQAATPQAPSPTPRSAGHPARRARGGSSVAGEPRLLRPLGLLIVVAVSAVLNTEKLSQNGYANIFYSAAVKSMLVSLHNFLYASSDPGGLVSVDKPPLGLWVQVASAKVFGFAPLSLLLPEAIAGVLTVALLYVIIARRVGTVAAFAGALTLAVFPGFVAVSRDNGVDPLLILLMLAACGTGLRAIESGRWRTIILTGVLVGLAFNTKTLAAVLVVPGIVIGYLVCAPGTISRRLLKLAAGGLAMLVVSFSWIAFVDLTPAAERPYVGSSTNNSELGLTFEYNGFGRVEGQTGGPGQVFLLPGATVVPQPAGHRRTAAAGQHPAAPTAPPKESTFLPNGRYRNPIPFGSAPSPVRLFGKGLGDQAGWIVPFALFGMIAAALLARLWWRGSEPDSDAEGAAAAGPDPEIAADPGAEHGAGIGAGARPEADAEPGARRGADAEPGAGPGYEPGAKPETDPNPDPGGRGGADPRTKPDRRDPRLACLLVLGVWFVVEATVLSLSKGIVHPYYVSALAPSAGAMTGIGAVALVRLRGGSRPRWAIALAALAILGTVAVQIVLLERESWEVRLIPVLVLGGLLGTGVFAARPRLAAKTMALT